MNGDLRFVNYGQVYGDFELDERDDLMGKCLIIACRT